jgi:hypothetical protein
VTKDGLMTPRETAIAIKQLDRVLLRIIKTVESINKPPKKRRRR